MKFMECSVSQKDMHRNSFCTSLKLSFKNLTLLKTFAVLRWRLHTAVIHLSYLRVSHLQVLDKHKTN